MTACFHCGLPADKNFSAILEGREQQFCCVACQTVAQAIVAGGLSEFYQYRDQPSSKANENTKDFNAYDLPEVQQGFVCTLESGDKEALLSVDGIHCAACAWLIEERVKLIDGVVDVVVNASNYRCRIVWNDKRTSLSQLMAAVSSIGYTLEPFSESQLQVARKKSARMAVTRLGVAGFGMMQVGMFAIALHAGDFQGMDTDWRGFFRWVSFLVATPVVLFAAQPFFKNAWRSFSNKRLSMDVPVAIAIGLAYIASVWATVTNTGDVYFDSISMFTFFLLLGRFLEMRVRHGSAFNAERMSNLLPFTVNVLEENGEQNVIPIAALKEGDLVCVESGESIPCDGRVHEGASSVDESVLSGESAAVKKIKGDKVFSGTLNGESRLVINATSVGEQTYLSSIERLVDRAATQKPSVVSLADKIAGRFVLFVLLSAIAVSVFWFYHDAQRALWIVLSVLVATCPCALSLATPVALTAGVTAMRRLGVLVASDHFVEKLTQVDHVVFDKTGTLTLGALTINAVKLLGDMDEAEALAVAAAMEAHSQHPIARAFEQVKTNKVAQNVNVVSGRGISACVDGEEFYLGTAEYSSPDTQVSYPGVGAWVLLSRERIPQAWIELADQPREGIGELFSALDAKHISYELLSGDREENVSAFAEQYNLPCTASALPEDKLERIQSLQKQGKQVLMVGDGVNDVPTLKAADLSIAMGEATRLAQVNADGVLANGRLSSLVNVIQLALRVRGTIKQNLTWAFLYNASVLPLAAAGYVPPYLAAIGMSASSVFVVLNALRINRHVKSYG